MKVHTGNPFIHELSMLYINLMVSFFEGVFEKMKNLQNGKIGVNKKKIYIYILGYT